MVGSKVVTYLTKSGQTSIVFFVTINAAHIPGTTFH